MAANIDRHLTINAGWFAGPAAGAIMTGVGLYFDVPKQLGDILIAGGLAVFACSTLIALIVAKGRRSEVTGQVIVMCCGIVIFFIGAGWYFWPTKNDTISKADTAIASHAQVDPNSVKNMSNNDLINFTIYFASKMKDFDINSNEMEDPHFATGDTEEQKNVKWQIMLKRQEFKDKEKRKTFTDNYMPVANTLRNEILKRLTINGLLPPYFQDDQYLLTEGEKVLTQNEWYGARPVSDAANYIETLARLLPQ